MNTRRSEDRWHTFIKLACVGNTTGSQWEVAYRDLECLVRSMARQLGVQPYSLEDVVQDVMAIICLMCWQCDDPRKFIGWVRTIVRRVSCKTGKRESGAPQTGHQDLPHPESHDSRPFAREDDKMECERELSRKTLKEQVLLRRAYLEAKPYDTTEAIALDTGYSVKSVRTMLCRARRGKDDP